VRPRRCRRSCTCPTPCPTLLGYGTAETAEFARQTQGSLKDRGFDVELLALPRNHVDVLDDLADPDGPLARAVMRLAGT
jgi:hypothetical protein